MQHHNFRYWDSFRPYLETVGVPVGGVFMAVIAGNTMTLLGIFGLVDWVPYQDFLWPDFWLAALIACLLFIPFHVFHKQRVEFEELKKMLQRFHKTYKQGEQVYAAVASELKTDADEDECKEFLRERVVPWIVGIQDIVKDTRWGRTDLSEGVVRGRPAENYECIYRYIRKKNCRLEEMRRAYHIVDEDD